jgi:hypothetical protein
LLLAAALWCAGIVLTGGVLGATLFGGRAEGLPTLDEPLRQKGVSITPAVDGPQDVRLKARRPGDDADVPRWTSTDVAADEARPDDDDASRATESIVHAVRPGETLTTIARGYLGARADWNELAAANAIAEPYVLQIDQQLVLPDVVLAKTAATVALRLAIESEAEVRTRALFGLAVNSAPKDAFEPPEEGLRLERPLREAFRWDVVLIVAAGFVAALVVAVIAAVASAERKANMRCMLAALGRGALASGGAAVCCGWVVLVLAQNAASRPFVQTMLACACGLAAGLAAFVGARDLEARTDGSARVARRFAIVVGMILTVALIGSIATGWAAEALNAVRLPG